MKVVIVAGGKGTRVQGINSEIPKAMFPVKGKPVLEHQLEMLKEQGFNDFIFCIGHLGDQIHDYFGDGSDFEVNIQYCMEKELLGTGGAVKNAHKLLDSDFVVIYGDVMMDVDVRRMVNFHKEKGGKVTIILHETDHPWDSDLIEIDGNDKVVKLHAKPNEEPYPSKLSKSSVFVFSDGVVNEMPDGKFDMEKDFILKMIESGDVYGYVTDEFLKDMGTPERYEKVGGDMVK